MLQKYIISFFLTIAKLLMFVCKSKKTRVKTAWFHSRLCALSLFTGGGTDYIALHCEGFEILKKAHSLYK